MTILDSAGEDPDKVLHEHFIDRGYSTGSVYVPALRLTVPLGNNRFYRKDDLVQDIHTRTGEIVTEHGFEFEEKRGIGQGMLGRYIVSPVECEDRLALGNDILINPNQDLMSRITNEGHEHGHLIWDIDRRMVYDKYKIPSAVVEAVENTEDFAMFCGFLATGLFYASSGSELTSVHLCSAEPDIAARFDQIFELFREHVSLK